MQYKNLGSTGLKVSELCLGCMTFGVPERGDHPWTLAGKPKPPVDPPGLGFGDQFFRHRQCLFGRDLRGNRRTRAQGFHAPRRGGDRHQGLLPDEQGPERQRPVPQSHLHRHRCQPAAARHRLRGSLPDSPLGLPTPIEETLEALHDVVKAGKARYLGASSMYAWQFSKALHLARQHGWTPFRQHAKPTTTCCTAKKSAKCCRCAPTRGIAVHTLESARPRPLDPCLDDGDAAHPDRPRTAMLYTSTPRHPIGGSSIRSPPSPPPAACRRRRSPSRG